jgi:hypothetical protein
MDEQYHIHMQYFINFMGVSGIDVFEDEFLKIFRDET